MKRGLLFLLLCILAKDASCFSSMFMNVLSEEWETYKLKFSKVYDNLFEEQLRMRVYAEKKLKVADHNQKYYEGKVSYLIGMNHFSDMLPHELSRYKGLKMDFSNKRNDGVTFIGPHESIVLPDSMDWREHGAVTPIKNQGPCGSCWAFAAVGSLEGQHFRKTKKLVSLSEQNLVDCVPNEGCEGGQMTDAFIYVRDNNGIDTEESYPYLAIDADCRFNKSTIGATDKGYTKLPVGDENALLKAVATIGPITVGIDASEYGFDDYKAGVYHSPDCSKTRLDHGVLVVGYGTNEKGEDYWLVKNSWGKYWGMNGYGMMARNKDNNCGIATEATYPLV